MAFGDAVVRYLKAKARKRSIADDVRWLALLTRAFGADTPLTEITSSRISAWKAERLVATSRQTGTVYSAASINRPLAALRHLLRLAREEWEVVATVPRIREEKEPEGRIRWLAPEEEARLLAACRAIPTAPDLADIVTVAIETGMRKGELLGLTWERVDLSRGVLRLEITKSGKRREVPMRQAVYTVLAARPGAREGRVWPRVKRIDGPFDRARKAASVDDFRFHDLRHHFASWYMMRGGDLYALSKILGHAKVSMTEKYAHLAPDHLRAEMAKTERAAESASPSSAQSALTTREAYQEA